MVLKSTNSHIWHLDLPQVSYRDVELGKLLGKGSFGDVYEGTAHNIDYEGGKRISVAIKVTVFAHTVLN